MSNKHIKESDLAKAGLAKCPVTGCGRPFKLAEDQKGNPPKRPPICPDCEKFVQKLLFWLPRVHIQRGVTPGGLIVPGSPQFKQEVKPNESIKSQLL